MPPNLLFILLQFSFLEVWTARSSYRTYPTPSTTRKKEFVAQVVRKSCLLKPDTGPCRSEIHAFYYDPDKEECKKFIWGGCQGNGNRFASRRECNKTCLSQESDNVDWYMPRYCSLTFDYGYCFGALKRYYFDRQYKVCKEALYSGCGGNKNNFYTLENCDLACRLGKGHLLGIGKKRGGLSKVLIINPRAATRKRGKKQKKKHDTTKPSGTNATM